MSHKLLNRAEEGWPSTTMGETRYSRSVMSQVVAAALSDIFPITPSFQTHNIASLILILPIHLPLDIIHIPLLALDTRHMMSL
jgi:hypothetical protein